MAGYYLNRDDDANGENLLSLSGTITDGPMDGFRRWSNAKAVEEQFPLTEVDIALIAQAAFGLKAVRAIIDAKTPRWLIGWRDICRATDERTSIFSVLPQVGVGHTCPLLYAQGHDGWGHALLLANLNSLVLDFVARLKVGGTHLTYSYFKQFPVLRRSDYLARDEDFIVPRVLELTYTADDLRPWAEDLGYDGDPFPWDPERRAVLRAELDAYYARLYGLTRDELRYVLDPAEVMGPDYPGETFRVLKKNEEREFGEYRTRRLVLEAWDRLAESARVDAVYRGRRDPAGRQSQPGGAMRPQVQSARGDVIPFPRVRPSYEERYRGCLPVLKLKAAAGGFSEEQLVEFEDWVEVPVDIPLRKGMFIAQVVGRSMEPGIADGAWCIFETMRGARPREGEVVLVQLHEVADPEHGGKYTVKRFRSRRFVGEDGDWNTVVRLEPDNAEFPTREIVHVGGAEPPFRVIARLVKAFAPEPSMG